MTPLWWKIAGLVSLAAAAVLAIASIPVAVAAVEAVPDRDALLTGLRALILAVLAGVAFFTGLACFFWSNAVEARTQRAEIIQRLAAVRPPESRIPGPAPEARAADHT